MLLVTDPNNPLFNSCATVDEAKARVAIYYPETAETQRWADEEDDVIAMCLIGGLSIMDEAYSWMGYRTYYRQKHAWPRKGNERRSNARLGYRGDMFSFTPFEIPDDIKDLNILLAYCIEYRSYKRRVEDDLSNETPGFDLLVNSLSASGLSVSANGPDVYSELDMILSDPFHHITRLSKPYCSDIRGGVITGRRQYDYTTTTSTTSTTSTTTSSTTTS